MTPIDPLAVAVAVVSHLEALGIPHTIGGSIASSFAGEPRSTVDIDVVVAIDAAQVDPLIARLSPEFYADADAFRRAIQFLTSVNIIHQATQLKVDLFVAGGSPLDARQIARRRRVDLGDGLYLHVHPPEDILLQKLRWYRLGGGLSDRQWRDILGIIKVQRTRLDRAYLLESARVLSVEDLLARALDQAGE